MWPAPRRLGLQDHGHKSIKVPLSDTAYNLYYSGPMDGSRHHGVALALSDQANNALLAWEPVSSHLARVRLRGALFNISIIAVYAPTLDADEVTKDAIYDSLQAVMDGISPINFVVIAGDFNVRTGTGDANNRHIAIGDRCSNGERLIDFAAANRLTVSSTRFQHPWRHLVT
ncbi:unnamed protein product [Acanthosepion pharaonis]|uniref:Endonuclease/exonuclease/phosphatase domain-containing protein n=1 Tax=Acanthosepion pharaonis TaxID=158019 RepID=A0A812CXM0_ACAPH|nr:unnamed protein product [Sepia pharaonis]